jgi:hypothetical protein
VHNCFFHQFIYQKNVEKDLGTTFSILILLAELLNHHGQVDKHHPPGEHEYGVHVYGAKVHGTPVQVVKARRRVEASRDRVVEHARHVDFQKPEVGQVEVASNRTKYSFIKR